MKANFFSRWGTKIKAMSRKKKLISIGIIAAVVILIIILCKVTAGDETEATETTTAEATIMTIENTVSSSGEIESSLEEEVSPHTGYYLESIEVEEGAAVEEGDPILTYTNGKTMKAPYNCVVESWSLPDEEDQITSSHYVTIAGTDVLTMSLSVGEEDIASITMGAGATITVEATSSEIEGEVTYVSQVGNYSGGSSTFDVKVTFQNDGSLKLGMSASVALAIEEAENVLGVPVAAVSTRNGESYVTVQSGNQTTEVTVTTGIKNDAYIEITSGLEEGDIVVVPVTDDDESTTFGGFGGGGDMEMPDGGGDMPQGGGGMPQ